MLQLVEDVQEDGAAHPQLQLQTLCGLLQFWLGIPIPHHLPRSCCQDRLPRGLALQPDDWEDQLLHRRRGPETAAHLLLPPHVLPPHPQPNWLHLLCDQPEGEFKRNQRPKEEVAVGLFQIVPGQGDTNTDGI